MPITNTWGVVQLEAYPEYENETNVVFNVHWNLTGTDDTHTGYVYGSVGIQIDEETEFTPFAELTQEQVIGWVQDTLGEEQVANYEQSVADQIEASKNPTVVTPTLPWMEESPIVEEAPAEEASANTP